MHPRLAALALLLLTPLSAWAVPAPVLVAPAIETRSTDEYSVLILGGGVAGIIAARQLAAAGVKDFLIVEARHELGGRMMSHELGGSNPLVVELGANWIQGGFTGDGPVNPILKLADKHKLNYTLSDFGDITTFDHTGYSNYSDLFDASLDALDEFLIAAGQRVEDQTADLTGLGGFSAVGWKPKTPQEKAVEYFNFDWEYAQTPQQSSWIASSYNSNYTFDSTQGGFSEDNFFSTDQRGFKHLIQAEAFEFLKPSQLKLNATVEDIAYSSSGVTVTLKGGTVFKARKGLVTFSLGVLQNEDVSFSPSLPSWKQEAIYSNVMATYTKVFLQFSELWWDETFSSQYAIYADPHQRGKHPVWQNLDLEGFFPDSKIIFVTVTGDYSIYFETLSNEQAQAEVMDVLRVMFPSVTVPAPVEFFYYRWHQDPLYRGTYSNWPASFLFEHYENLRAPVDNSLFFAGEATSFKYYGFLHGAYFEGQDAGNALAACVTGNTCSYTAHFDNVKNCFKDFPAIVG